MNHDDEQGVYKSATDNPFVICFHDVDSRYLTLLDTKVTH